MMGTPSVAVGLFDGIPDVWAPLADPADPLSWPLDQIDAYDKAPAAALTSGLALVPSRVPPKPTLRDRVERVAYIADVIEQLDDEAMTDELRDQLSAQLIEELAGTREKVDSTCAVLGMFESLEAAAEKEIERLAKRVTRYQAQRERLELYVLAVLTASSLDRIEGDTSTISRRLNPPKVVIEDGAALGHEFMRYPPAPPPEPDKAAIKKALLAKRKVKGARLEQGARLVRS